MRTCWSCGDVVSMGEGGCCGYTCCTCGAWLRTWRRWLRLHHPLP